MDEYELCVIPARANDVLLRKRIALEELPNSHILDQPLSIFIGPVHSSM